MAYVALTAQTTGGTGTAAWANQIKDNFAAGVPDLFTTKGDLAAATGADAAVRLAVGTNYQLLEALSSATPGVSWSSGVFSLCYKSGVQAISTGSLTKVQIASAVSDTLSFLDNVNNRLTVPVGTPTRYYAIVGFGYFSGHATVSKYRHLEIQKNGTPYIRQSSLQDDGSLACGLNVNGMVEMAAGDYIELFVEQTSGGNLNFNEAFLGLYMIR